MNETCPFCSPTELLDSALTAVAQSDAFPLSEGHTLDVLRRHVLSLFHLSAMEQAELWQLVAQVRSPLIERLHPDALNIGINDGDAAGQTVSHAHDHVIPRYHGDVFDPRDGIRWIIPEKAAYWEGNS